MLVHKINHQNAKDGILTHYHKENNILEATMITPENVKLSAGDAIGEIRFFKQVGDKAVLLRIESILEERQSKGKWNGTPPTWRKLLLKQHGFTKDELGDVIKVETTKDGDKLYLA